MTIQSDSLSIRLDAMSLSRQYKRNLIGVDEGDSCTSSLQANPRYNVRVQFTDSFGVYANDKETCFHWVEIKYANDLTPAGPR